MENLITNASRHVFWAPGEGMAPHAVVFGGLVFHLLPPTALKEEVKYQSSRNDCVGDEGKKNRKLFSTSKLLSYKNSCQATYLGSNVS